MLLSCQTGSDPSGVVFFNDHSFWLWLGFCSGSHPWTHGSRQKVGGGCGVDVGGE